jgi:general secretion pathway protein A
MILVGQVESQNHLSLSVNEPLAQRLVVPYHITGLSREELPVYQKHCLKLAGAQMGLFEAPALEGTY